MPRLIVPDALLSWRERLSERRWRGLIWLPGTYAPCLARAQALWNARSWQSPLWVAPEPPPGLEHAAWLPAAKARTRLGGEHELVVIDALSLGAGFDPEAFGALTGTLVAGGWLVLLTPADWGRRPDADYRRLADHLHRPERLTSRYLARLAAILAKDGQLARWSDGEEPSVPVLPAEMELVGTFPDTADSECATSDQARAVERLLRLRRRRPLVLSADRGRGKSAALGIACARWLARGERDVLVTAPRPAAVETLFVHLQRGCPEGRRDGNVFTVVREGQRCRVRFVAPDALCTADEPGLAGGPGSLLLVDEAAAIPAARLGEWLVRFPRIAFATTVHGYEGSGRGFALRFLPHLARHAPEWRECRLETPVRWARGDPLEALTTRMLLLDAEPLELAMPVAGEVPLLRRWQRSTLAADEARLVELFGLLVQAHYRTQPSDLRRLLDGPGVSITSLDRGDQALAVTLCVEEGGFGAELAERVARGERRPRGHLLAQSLAAHAGCRQALMARVRRIMRIAVHRGARRQGHGRRLLCAELDRARHDGVDLLGASFGADPGLMAFWRSAGFRAVRLGLSRETSTGEHALMVVMATSPHGRQVVDTLVQRFQALLPTLLAFELRDLDPDVAAALLSEGEVPALDTHARRDVDDVALGHREPALARPALQQLVRRALAGGGVQHDDAWLLVATLFQRRDPVRVAARLGVSGRRGVEARLREALGRLRHWAQ